MSESEKENLENTHEGEAGNNTSGNPSFEGDYEDNVLEEQYLTSSETEVGRVLSENAELKLALLQTKRANIRIWTLAAVMAAVLGVAMFMWLAVFPKYKKEYFDEKHIARFDGRIGLQCGLDESGCRQHRCAAACRPGR